MVWGKRKTRAPRRKTYRRKRSYKKRMTKAKRLGKRMLSAKVQQGISMRFTQMFPLTNITPVANN